MSDILTSFTGWERLGTLDPKGLTDARLQLHHAVQLIVSAAISYLPPRDDDSHTSLEWAPHLGVLSIQPLGSDGLRFGVRVTDLTLVSLQDQRAMPDTDGHDRGSPVGAERFLGVGSTFTLVGRTNVEALAWLSEELQRTGRETRRLTTRSHYEIPPHDVVRGAPYRASPGYAELARYYHDGWLAATQARVGEAGWEPVRCWPHHFDIASLLTLPEVPGLPARTVGVGLSPGDEWYAEPYLYVSPRPQPLPELLPPLSHGHWHTTGWTGAALLGSRFPAIASPNEQQNRATAFIVEGVAACRRMLDSALPRA